METIQMEMYALLYKTLKYSLIEKIVDILCYFLFF